MNKYGKLGLILGQNATGKSWFIRKLLKEDYFKNFEVISEGTYLLESIQNEHKKIINTPHAKINYTHHDHPWCKGALYHNHRKNNNIVIFKNKEIEIPYSIRKNIIPFDINNQELVKQMRRRTFYKAQKIISSGKNCLIEITTGYSLNKKNSTDFSCNEISRGMQKGIYPTKWFKHIAWVIVTRASKKRRNELNFNHKNKVGRFLKKTESPLRSRKALDLFGRFDFSDSDLEKELIKTKVPVLFFGNKTDKLGNENAKCIIERVKTFI